MVKETAEQKLLKLIESQEGASPERNNVQNIAQAVKGGGISSLKAPAFFEALPGLIKNLGGKSPEAAFGLPQINNLLIAVVVVVLFFLLMSFIQGAKLSRAKLDMEAPLPASTSLRPAVTPAKDASEYLESLKARNIFYPYEKKEEEQAATNTTTPKISDKIKDLKLVGISWLNSAESATAMIEDTKTSVTHFLKQGDEINGVKIKTIYADRVILGFEDEVTFMKL